MRTILVAISVLILSIAIYTIVDSGCWDISSATLLILTLTLIALLIYVYDTNRIASITNLRWDRDNILNTSYELRVEPDKQSLLFYIFNHSNLIIRAKVKCNLKIYGEPVESNEVFDGINSWYLFPQQQTQARLEISTVLSKKGKTIQNMIDERTEDNRQEQFTMDLEIKFRDEFDNKREFPTRRHFFDFAVKKWVPIISWKDDWEN